MQSPSREGNRSPGRGQALRSQESIIADQLSSVHFVNTANPETDEQEPQPQVHQARSRRRQAWFEDVRIQLPPLLTIGRSSETDLIPDGPISVALGPQHRRQPIQETDFLQGASPHPSRSSVDHMETDEESQADGPLSVEFEPQYRRRSPRTRDFLQGRSRTPSQTSSYVSNSSMPDGPISVEGPSQYRRRLAQPSDFIQERRRALVSNSEGSDFDDDANFGDAEDGEDHDETFNQQDFRLFMEQISRAQMDLNGAVRNVARSIETLATTLTQQSGFHDAGGAGNLGLGVTRTTRGPKLTTHPVRRSEEQKHFLNRVRLHLERLTGGRNRLLEPTVTLAEAARFENSINFRGEEQQPCCTPAAFRIHLLGTPRHPWNRSAARVFARHYIHYYQLEPHVDTALAIMKAFFTRVKGLRKMARMRNQRQHSRSSRRHQRKRGLFFRRLEISQMHPKLQMHTRMLQRLGVEGMSSDESDHEEAMTSHSTGVRRPKYHVLLPVWRAPELSKWLHVFDSVYHASRRSAGPSRGDYPRVRQHNQLQPRMSASTRFVPDLPRCAYSEMWLDSAHPDFVDLAVRPREETYHLVHDNDLIHTFPLSRT